jgi:hypothetical protein
MLVFIRILMQTYYENKSEDNKEVIIWHISKNDRQWNGPRKRTKEQMYKTFTQKKIEQNVIRKKVTGGG